MRRVEIVTESPRPARAHCLENGPGQKAGATLILATTKQRTFEGGRFLEACRRGYLGGTVNGNNVINPHSGRE